MQKIKKYSKNILKGCAIVGIAFLGIATQYTDEFEIAKNIEIFSNVYREVHTYYVDELETEKVMRTGINAMLNSLDPYTAYIAPDEVERFKSGLSGKYGGVGASVVIFDKKPVVTDVYEDSPAAKGGLKTGDILLIANGVSLDGKSVLDISKELRGAPNSDVVVEVRRAGEAKNIRLTLRREEITLPNVPLAKMLNAQTAYIHLSAFTENSGKNLTKELLRLRNNNKIENIILDLRNNGGGLLSESVNVANLFLAKNQLVVQLKSRDIDQQQNYSTLNNPFDTTAQLVVLINNRSASASEIVAGALQDLDRGVIIGERSFGKGLVQTTKELAYGAKLKVTTARYYIPSGRCIQSSAYKDGAPVAIADSLRTAFKTRIGRKVLDGGGVSPDISLANPEYQELLTSLNQQFLLFDFATTFQQKNATLPDGKDFKLADKTFDEFIAFIQQKGYTFQRETDKMLDELEKKAKEEGLLDEVKADIAKMRAALAAEKTALLQKYKNEIIQNLQSEIVRRYYFERGRLENSLTNDPAILQALNIFADKTAYKKMLGK